MRQFSETEKQQLQTKIENQERKQRIVGDIIRKNKEAKAAHSLGIPWKYGFLAIILCLLAINVIIYFVVRHYDANSHIAVLNLVVVLMLLLNHVAFYFSTSGRLSTVMKTVACIVAVLGLAHAAYVFWLTV
ncbi:MAG: hypothetical protein OXN17_12180 [Candidatus Poribacteria bacterium]|nr:hypothetical protein [Candidatus Poribacteria bacterium]MDE0505249.1 hypothetical protein [Candidatus Poribacteria bacterium]